MHYLSANALLAQDRRYKNRGGGYFCVALIEEMLKLRKEYAKASSEKLPRADALKRHIDQVDADIDRIVYQLYGLAEEEIKIVAVRTQA